MNKLTENNGDLPNYEDYIIEDENDVLQEEAVAGASKPTAFVGVHATSFKDMLNNIENSELTNNNLYKEELIGLCSYVEKMGFTEKPNY